MPTPKKGPRLGGSPAHERMILSNLATSLFEHGSITTTQAKAKRLQPLAETLITKAKRGDLAARRQVMRTVRDKTVVHVLFTEIGERFADRPGGYTRITKLGPRKGDNAPMVVIELVESMADSKKKAKKSAAKKSTAKKAEPKKDEAKKDEAKKDEAKEDEPEAEPKEDEPKKDDVQDEVKDDVKDEADAPQAAEAKADDSE